MCNCGNRSNVWKTARPAVAAARSAPAAPVAPSARAAVAAAPVASATVAAPVARAAAAAPVARAAVVAPVVSSGGGSGVDLVYEGPTALTAVGRVTQTRYRFAGRGARLRVDARDAPSLVGIPRLRRV
jgi:hypothetical protein